MTITKRLSLSFSLLVVSILIIVVVAVVVITGFQERFYYVQNNIIPSMEDSGAMTDTSKELIIRLYRHRSAIESDKKAQFEKGVYDELEKLKSMSSNYLEQRISNDEERKIAEKNIDLIGEFESRIAGFINASIAQNDAVTLDELQGGSGIGYYARELIANNFNLQKLNVKISDEFREHNDRIHSFTLWSMFGGSLVAILFFGIVVFKIISSIRKSLESIRNTMDKSSSYLDLTLRADDSRKDEIGLTAKAYNHLISKVEDSISAVKKSADLVSTAATEFASGNEDLSSRTEEQAASLEQTASNMSELSETVKNTAENTNMASHLSNNARNISDYSAGKVQDMLKTMSDIRTSSAQITDIISLIESIAFQTNILALNAAVEAARAGEHGRGFAVVAGEVRSLAQRSSSSAREIKELIESSMQFVMAGAEQAENVGENMNSMRDAVKQVADLINDISSAAQEQMIGIEQVHKAVSQMDDVTQQNAALVEEASASSHSLMGQADTLKQLVSAFVIESKEKNDRIDSSPKKHLLLSDINIQENWRSF